MAARKTWEPSPHQVVVVDKIVRFVQEGSCLFVYFVHEAEPTKYHYAGGVTDATQQADLLRALLEGWSNE